MDPRPDPAGAVPGALLLWCGDASAAVAPAEATRGWPFVVGRAGDLRVGAGDEHLHRAVVEVHATPAGWWVRRVGRHAPVEVVGASGRRVPLELGVDELLRDGVGALRFGRYEVRYELAAPPARVAPARAPAGAATRPRPSAVPAPSGTERRVLEALCRPRRDGDPAGAVPSDRYVARELGTTVESVRRAIDRYCAKLARAGVGGVKGDSGCVADGRRVELVRFLLEAGVVGPPRQPGGDAPTPRLSSTPT